MPGAVQVAVGVAHLEPVDGGHERAAGQLGVAVDDVLQVAHEVVGVEALLLVAGEHRRRERVRARGEGVAQDSVAGGADVERHGVRMAALVPVVADGHLDGLVAVGEPPVLHSPAEELFLGAARQDLGRLAAVPGGTDQLLPQQRPVVGPVQGEAQLRLVDPQDHRGGPEQVVGPGVGDLRGDTGVVALDDDVGGGGALPGGRGVGRVGEGAVGGDPDPEQVVGEEDHPGLRRGRGDRDRVALHRQPGDRPGADRRRGCAPGGGRQPEQGQQADERDERSPPTRPSPRPHRALVLDPLPGIARIREPAPGVTRGSSAERSCLPDGAT